MKTLLFEREFGVSIDDFEDITQIDRFIEGRIGKPLMVVDRRDTLTLRGGNVFKIRNITRDSLEADIDKSLKEVEAQLERLKIEERA